jgi:hypothetical protein
MEAIVIGIIRTLINHSTLNPADKQELLGLIDALEAPETPAPAAAEPAPAGTGDGTSAGA